MDRLVLVALVCLAACATPSEKADALQTPKSPLHGARVGDMCRYRSIREGQGDPVVETWTFRVAGMSRGTGRVNVSVLGPPRVPASPSPREPGYSLLLPTADAGFAATELMRFFHRPDLTTEGMRVVLDREGKKITGEERAFPVVVQDSTHQAWELVVHFADPSLEATYRAVIVDGLPVLGIKEAELDEVWTSVAEDGSLHPEHCHEKLELVASHDTSDTR
jgi:hypothetical protein